MARAMGPLQDRHLSALNNSDMSSKLDEGRDDGNCICVVSDDEGQLPHNRIRMGEGGGNPRRVAISHTPTNSCGAPPEKQAEP